jgi:hypothetical protein
MTTETKIRGLKITITKKNIRIENSYQITNQDKMKEILEEILQRDTDYKTNRNIKSLMREWNSHNRLYKLKIFRKYNKNCNLKYKVNIFGKIIYLLLGIKRRKKHGRKDRNKRNRLRYFIRFKQNLSRKG